MLKFTLKVGFGDSFLFGFLYFPRPEVGAIVWHSGRFLSVLKREGGAIVAESRLEIDEEGTWEGLLGLVCLIVQNWVTC